MSLLELHGSGWHRTLSNWVAPDVLLVWGVAAAVSVLTAWNVAPGLRLVLVGPAVFLLPGYVVVAALYPQDATAASGGSYARVPGTVDARERLALSFGLSLATLPLLGMAIGVSPWSFSETAAVRAFGGFVVVAGLVAALRRRRLAPADRFRLPVGRWTAEARASVASGPVTDRALNVVVLAAIVLALGTVGYALAVPPTGQGFTDFAVLTDDGDELVAGGYPDELSAGESAALVTAVENHEGASREYTVVVTVERPAADGGTAREVELQRFQRTVGPGERWTHPHQVSPGLAGEDVRLNYYLYRGGAPEAPDASSADYHLYVWTSVGTGDTA